MPDDVEFTVRLAGPKIDLNLIGKVAQNLEIALRDIEQTMTGDDPQAVWEWKDEARLRAAASPNGASEATLLEAVHHAREAFRTAETFGTVEEVPWPTAVGPKARRAIREIVRLLYELDYMTIEATREQPLTIRRPERALAISKPTGYREFSSIDGLLDIISVRGRPHFSIKEHITGNIVRCVLPEDKFEEAKDALRHRVVVEGLVKYRQDGTPVSISDVTKLWVRPRPDKPISELRGSLPDFTGDVPAGEYVRRLREGEENG